MVPSEGAAPESGDRQWFIVGRWQEYEGEGRTNLIRIAGIAAFYIVELINYRGLKLGAFLDAQDQRPAVPPRGDFPGRRLDDGWAGGPALPPRPRLPGGREVRLDGLRPRAVDRPAHRGATARAARSSPSTS